MQRLFSNLELENNRFKHRPGSVVGATALVAGTTVGAGILALPAVTQAAGVVPSTVLLIGVWGYALVAALLMVEVNVQTICSLGRPGLGLLAMTRCTLGQNGARMAGGAYLFLHYALLVAYMAQGGEILVSGVQVLMSMPDSVPEWIGPLLFAVVFGSLLYFGRDRFIAQINSFFVALVIASFIGLLVLGSAQIEPTRFWLQDWTVLSPAVSVMFVTLFYHNVVPVITTQLEGDIAKIRRSILIGSAIPLAMFVLWNAIILGSIAPTLGTGNAAEAVVFDPLDVLRQGSAGVSLGVMISVFSELTIATSFIGFTYGLLDFFQDLWQVPPHDQSQRLPLYALVMVPAIVLATLNPTIFFTALDYAGTFSITILGGIIPAVMAWKLRAQSGTQPPFPWALVPGGNGTIVSMIGVAVMVLLVHLWPTPV